MIRNVGIQPRKQKSLEIVTCEMDNGMIDGCPASFCTIRFIVGSPTNDEDERETKYRV